MIIAHGPIGYLITRAAKRWWGKYNFSSRQQLMLLVTGTIGAMIPDLDLFYFYFIDATVAHRQLLTHSFIIYFCIVAVGLLLLLARRPWWAWLTVIFGLGGVVHILADMYTGEAAALAPLTSAVFGLVSLPDVADSWFGHYSFVINYGTEFIICLVVLGTVIRQRRRYIYGASVAALIAIGLLFWLNNHVYKPNGVYYYSDQDQDGIVTFQDRDSDGDQFVNMIDTDIDNDEEDNSLEFYKETFAADGSIYDYSNGGFIEVPLRVGLVTDAVLIQRMYANVGIFFGTEMANDYEFRPAGYIGQPVDNQFSDLPSNWKVWLGHTGHLLEPDVWMNEFDILFFQSGHVGLYVYNAAGEAMVLEADSSHIYTKTLPLQTVVRREGAIIALGRILPKPYSKRY